MCYVTCILVQVPLNPKLEVGKLVCYVTCILVEVPLNPKTQGLN